MEKFNIPTVADLTRLYINGSYAEPTSSERISIFNPNDNTLVSDRIPVASQHDVDVAVDIANKAFVGEWSSFSSMQRSRAMNRFADLLDEHLESILRLDSLASGAPCSLIPTREKMNIINVLRYYGQWTKLLTRG